MSDKPNTRTMSIAEIAEELPLLIDGVTRHETQIVVEQDGQPVAAIISIDEFRRIESGTGNQEWEETTRSMQRMSEAFADVPVEELEAKIDEIINDNRRQIASQYRSA